MLDFQDSLNGFIGSLFGFLNSLLNGVFGWLTDLFNGLSVSF